MNADDLKHLHPNDVRLWLHVEAAVWRLVKASHAPVFAVEPTPINKIECEGGTSLYGQCQYFWRNQPSRLLFTLRRRVNGKFVSKPLPLYQILDTIAHETAHAKCRWQDDHNAKWFRTYGKMILLTDRLKLRVDIEKAGAKLPA